MHVSVVDYRPQWAKQFRHERERLMADLSGLLVDMVHMGSTAVPGLAAKPVIDMMAGVASLSVFDAAHGYLSISRLGYDYHARIEASMPERRFFTEGDDNPEHPAGIWFQLHLVEYGKHFWRRHLAVCDYLRTHPDERDAYGQARATTRPRINLFGGKRRVHRCAGISRSGVGGALRNGYYPLPDAHQERSNT